MLDIDSGVPVVHPWQSLQITLEADRSYRNPYMEVDSWVDLKGPGFEKRIYGFWDGGDVFRVRLVATENGHALQYADGTPVRSAWRQAGTDSAEDMHNEGGRPSVVRARLPG